MGEVRVMKRRLSADQQLKQGEIIEHAARLLLKYGGRVSMEMVGEAAKVSRSTLYRYYASREHLLAEVTLYAGDELVRYLQDHPPEGKTIGERIEFLCRKMAHMAEESQRLLAACVNNMASNDPAVIDAHTETEQLISRIFETVSGRTTLKISAENERIVFRYLLGSFMLATADKMTFDELAQELANLCHRLMYDSWGEPCP